MSPVQIDWIPIGSLLPGIAYFVPAVAEYNSVVVIFQNKVVGIDLTLVKTGKKFGAAGLQIAACAAVFL